MRYFSYLEYMDDPNDDFVVTVSEDWIREYYYENYWKPRMKNHFVDKKDLNFENCLENWMITNLAWEVDENGKSQEKETKER